jgi:hypothetical protein
MSMEEYEIRILTGFQVLLVALPPPDQVLRFEEEKPSGRGQGV